MSTETLMWVPGNVPDEADGSNFESLHFNGPDGTTWKLSWVTRMEDGQIFFKTVPMLKPVEPEK